MEEITSGVLAGQLPGAVWRKSRYSNPYGNCLELAKLPGGAIAVRNSRYPDGVAQIYTRTEMVGFLEAVKAGAFDEVVG